MNTYWPSFKGDNGAFCTTNTGHMNGASMELASLLSPTCYGPDYQKYEDMTDYFRSVLSLHSKYDIYGALASTGVVPGGTYTQASMADAIKSALGITPYFKCKSGSINEIWAYFHVQGRDTYVPDDFKGKYSCSKSIK